MTRLNPIFTSLKTMNITYTKQETLLTTPETLPTSEPTTPQISYTVQSSDLPSIEPKPYSVKYVAFLIGAGKCVTAATIYYRMKKNGVSVASSSGGVGANTYYTWNCFFYDVNVGDVLELALWSSVSDSNWDYKAFHIQPTRIIPSKYRLLGPCDFSLTTQPVLTFGSPSYSSSSSLPYHDDYPMASISVSKRFSYLFVGSTYGVLRVHNGDNSLPNSAALSTSTTSRPFYRRNIVPTQIKFRGVILG